MELSNGDRSVTDSVIYHSNMSSKGRGTVRQCAVGQRRGNRVSTVTTQGSTVVDCNGSSNREEEQDSPIRVEPPVVASNSNSKKRDRSAYLMTGPQSKKSRACRLALESSPASVGAGIRVGAFRVSHVSRQTVDDESTVSVVEEGLAAYEGTYSARREASASAARLSSIL